MPCLVPNTRYLPGPIMAPVSSSASTKPVETEKVQSDDQLPTPALFRACTFHLCVPLPSAGAVQAVPETHGPNCCADVSGSSTTWYEVAPATGLQLSETWVVATVARWAGLSLATCF